MGIWNPDFRRPDFKRSGFSYGYSPNHLKTGPFKIRKFLSRFQMVFWKNGSHLSGFQKVGLPDFRSHIQTICNPTSCWQFKIQISNPHYLTYLVNFNLCIYQRQRCLIDKTSKVSSTFVKTLQFVLFQTTNLNFKMLTRSQSKFKVSTRCLFEIKFWSTIN